MSLSEALRGLLEARGLRPPEVADRVSGTRNRATVYRALSGDTNDPRLSTLVELCNVLRASPSELLRLAGLFDDEAGTVTLVDVALRQAFGELQELNDEDQRLCLAMLRGLIEMRTEQPGRRRRRSGRPT